MNALGHIDPASNALLRAVEDDAVELRGDCRANSIDLNDPAVSRAIRFMLSDLDSASKEHDGGFMVSMRLDVWLSALVQATT